MTYLTYWDMIGALNTATGAKIQVCSKSLGVVSNIANCVTCTGYAAACGAAAAGSPAPAADPEPTHFVLNRVDVTYCVRPIIPGISILPASLTSATCPGQYTFHRQVSMRAMD